MYKYDTLCKKAVFYTEVLLAGNNRFFSGNATFKYIFKKR